LHNQNWNAIAGVGAAGPIGSTIPGSIVTGGLTTGSVISSGAASSGYAASFQIAPTGTLTASNYNAGLDLRGDADILIAGMSLKDFMKQVTLRLNLMVPNPEIEKQWDELRTLGEAYRAVEKECLEKAKVWDILKRDNI
jgi:hypothetical protein